METLTNSIDIIAERDGNVLLVHASYRGHESKPGQLDAFFAVQVDLNKSFIYPPHDLENYYRFGVWNEVDKNKGNSYLLQIKDLFSKEEIKEKIVKPILQKPYHTILYNEKAAPN